MRTDPVQAQRSDFGDGVRGLMVESGLTLLLFVPLFVIVLLANVADKQRADGGSGTAYAGIAYALHLAIFGTMTMVGALLHFIGISMRASGGMRQGFLDMLSGGGVDQLENLMPVLGRLEALGLGLWVPAVAAPLLLLPAVRGSLSRVLQIDPLSSVHAIAVTFVMLAVVNLTFTLGVGLETLADLSEAAPSDSGGLLLSLWVQQLTFALWALVGIGWLTRRTLAQALGRLGLVLPQPKEVAIGIGTGLVSVGVILALEMVAASAGWGFDENVERLTESLIGPLLGSIPGILTLGLAAGIGEETLFRGALQPRFGLLFTSLLFAVVHSQYGITLSTLAVFIVGLILGGIRIRFNTSTCVIAHAAYNITLGLIAYLYPQVF